MQLSSSITGRACPGSDPSMREQCPDERQELGTVGHGLLVRLEVIRRSHLEHDLRPEAGQESLA